MGNAPLKAKRKFTRRPCQSRPFRLMNVSCSERLIRALAAGKPRTRSGNKSQWGLTVAGLHCCVRVIFCGGCPSPGSCAGGWGWALVPRGGSQWPRPGQKGHTAHPRAARDLEQGAGPGAVRSQQQNIEETRRLPNSKPLPTHNHG